MTEQEAIESIEYLKDQLEDDSPDMFTYTGSEIKALDMAIKALDEIQQYREIEKQLKEQYHANVDIKELANYFIETIFKGEKHDRFCILTNEDAEKWEAYEAIGTVDECRAAVEKQTAAKPLGGKDIESNEYAICRECSAILSDGEWFAQYCPDCGKKVDWSDEE